MINNDGDLPKDTLVLNAAVQRRFRKLLALVIDKSKQRMLQSLTFRQQLLKLARWPGLKYANGDRDVATELAKVACLDVIWELERCPELWKRPEKLKKLLRKSIAQNATFPSVADIALIDAKMTEPPMKTTTGYRVVSGNLQWKTGESCYKSPKKQVLRADFDYITQDTIRVCIWIELNSENREWQGRYVRVSLLSETETLLFSEAVHVRDVFDPGCFSAQVDLLVPKDCPGVVRCAVEIGQDLPQDGYPRDRQGYDALALAGPRAGSAELVAWLFERVCDKNEGLRSAAVQALGSVGARQVTASVRDTLAQLLRNDDVALRIAAANAIDDLGIAVASKAIFEALANLLNGNVAERVAAAHAMAAVAKGIENFTLPERVARMRHSNFRAERLAATAVLINCQG